MIESITMKQIATYDDIGVEISNLQKINFIYGSNGCGKTTITKFIYNRDNIVFNECSLNWGNGEPIKTLVYNKDFRDKNFGKGSIDGIFTLGQATKDELESINKKQSELRELKSNLIKRKDTVSKQIEKKESLEDKFKETVWNEIYKKHETELKEAFVGYQKKETFRNKLLAEHQNNTVSLVSYDELKEKSDTIFKKAPVKISTIDMIEFNELLKIQDDAIWKKKVIGKADVEIAKLIQELNLNDWVSEGRNYLKNTTCPFCQQDTISEDFKIQLENYFDSSYTSDTSHIKLVADEYNRLAQNLINVLQQIESKEKDNEETKLNIEVFSAYLKTISSQVISNKERINNKIKEPSRSIELISVKEQLENIQQLIEDANIKVLKHNSIVTNYSKERFSLIQQVWKYLVEQHKTKITEFYKESGGLQKGIIALNKQIKDLSAKRLNLENEIKEANKNITSVQPSIDEINTTLKSYGFQNFEIVPSPTEENQYQIKREDGTLAESTLSEGEVTFITFLYFLQRAKGSTAQDLVSEERILVIDDPISSLDSNILFVVSALIKEIIKSIKKDQGSIKQLILMTHNVYFHKEVSFIDGRTKECGDTFYWILRKNNGVSMIQEFETKNPIMNSYELLWQELKNKDKSSMITIQNIMRRIIENYFKILGKYGDDDLIKRFSNYQEQQICRSLICWINDGSHSIPDDLFIEYPDTIIDKYFEVFKKIFAQMGHFEHYSMMMGEEPYKVELISNKVETANGTKVS